MRRRPDYQEHLPDADDPRPEEVAIYIAWVKGPLTISPNSRRGADPRERVPRGGGVGSEVRSAGGNAA
jgi:hypothetical protein